MLYEVITRLLRPILGLRGRFARRREGLSGEKRRALGQSPPRPHQPDDADQQKQGRNAVADACIEGRTGAEADLAREGKGLEERALGRNAAGRGDKGADAGIGGPGDPNARITSYNVCYTKLLRFSRPCSAASS